MKIFDKEVKAPGAFAWLLPGLEVKRWFFSIFAGAVLIAVGVCIFLEMRPVYHLINLVVRVARSEVSSQISGVIVLLIGLFLFIKGWGHANYSLWNVSDDRDKQNFLENLYRRRKLNRGPKIVAIGGGTGLSTLLKGIKKITNNLTAIVTVGDDGGSSGRLREETGVLPPGDIRNCIAALADDEDLVTKLFQYRFKTGADLKGHSFGNIFLTAMYEVTGDMYRAVIESSKVLSIRGTVLPATLDDMRLVALMEDNSVVKGESLIPQSGKKIKKLYTEPACCKPLPEAIEAIREAELIIMGPGSLYTSILPNLLIPELVDEIEKSKAKKIYICNVMTQPGETDGYSVSDHVKAILTHVDNKKIIDAVLVNTHLPQEVLERYKAENSFPVEVDTDELKKLGIDVFAYRMIDEGKTGLVRHNPSRLMKAVYYWFKKVAKQ
ncbi:MAG: uridine diphosphate-N-acetylglucosamine-binding protein YvcK [Candidatus Gastranaerophilaceae bacterium]